MIESTDATSPKPVILGVRACDCGIQGPENLILALADRLANRGANYVVANLWDGDPPEVALHDELVRRGRDSHVLRTRWGMSPTIILKLASLIRKLQPAVIHTHDVKAEFAAVLAVRGFKRRYPLLGSYYGRLQLVSRFLQAADLARFAVFRAFDRLLANSTAQKQELLRFRLPADRIDLIPSFVDADKLRPAAVNAKLDAKRKLGIDPSRKVLATIARLSINKGHTYMLQALSSMVHADPSLLYLIPGEGDMHWRGEGGLRGELQRQAEQLGIVENVKFLGYVPDVQTILHASDLIVSPSLLEGMQVALLEAMAAGLPIVATNIGGTPDAVADGESGILVPPADPDALAKACEYLLSDRQRCERMGANGRKRVEEFFHAQIVSNNFLRICEQVIGRRLSETA